MITCVPDPQYRLQENIVGTRSRVFFDPLNANRTMITGVLDIPNVGQESCQPITVYVRVRQHTLILDHCHFILCCLQNDLTPDQADPMSFTFSLVQFERSQSPVDTNFQPDNLVTMPVIESSPFTTTVCVYVILPCSCEACSH